jgi:hypothetical protein
MSDYADVAIRAALKLRSGLPISAREAWNDAAGEVFPASASMQSKGCPRTIFLTLCASGALKDLPAVGEVGVGENARHAKDCLALLAGHPDYLAMRPRQLWDLITNASGKTYNQQMHVILGLANAGLLQLGEDPQA